MMARERSVSHREGLTISRAFNDLQMPVPQVSPVQALGAIEAEVSSMTPEACLELLGATARLNAALSARNLVLAAKEAKAAALPYPDLLDARAAARRLGLSLPTIYRLARSGELPAVRLGNDLLRFAPSDIDAFIERHRGSLRS